jgi:hypothetical protein
MAAKGKTGPEPQEDERAFDRFDGLFRDVVSVPKDAVRKRKKSSGGERAKKAR